MNRTMFVLGVLVLVLLAGCASPGSSPSATSTTEAQRYRPEGPLTFEDTIAFVSDAADNYDIFVLAPGHEPIRLTDTEEDESFPGWSPDGSEIAFGRQESDNTIDLWVMSADGSEQRRIYDSGSYYLEGISWHPSGEFIYFSRGYFDGPGNMSQRIVLVSVDGSETQSALAVDGLWDRHFTYSQPALTTDGGRIAFGHYEGYAMPWRQEMYVGELASDGTSVSRIVQHTEDQAGDSNPAWSSDGTAIAWVHEMGINSGNYDIWVMDADGDGRRQVTSDPGQETAPVWSANGQAIIYASDEGGTFQLYSRYAWGDDEVLQLTDNDANNIQPDRRP